MARLIFLLYGAPFQLFPPDWPGLGVTFTVVSFVVGEDCPPDAPFMNVTGFLGWGGPTSVAVRVKL